ncbi:hypothetical protein N7493_009341, partial [Penicillium malachiteum]
EQLEGKSGASSRVKKLVVEPWVWLAGPPHREYWSGWTFPSGEPHGLHWLWGGNQDFYCEKIRDVWFYFVGF